MSGFRDPRPHWADPIESPPRKSPMAYIGVRLIASIAAASLVCVVLLAAAGIPQ